MKKTFLPWLAVVLGAVNLTAFAQTSTGIATAPPSNTPKMSANSQADSDYRAAQARCESQTGAAARTNCMNDARVAYDRALNANPNSSMGGDTNSATGTSAAGGQSGTPSSSGGASGATGLGASGTEQKAHGPTAIMDRATPVEKPDNGDASAGHPPTVRMDRSMPDQKSPATTSNGNEAQVPSTVK